MPGFDVKRIEVAHAERGPEGLLVSVRARVIEESDAYCDTLLVRRRAGTFYVCATCPERLRPGDVVFRARSGDPVTRARVFCARCVNAATPRH